MYPEIHKTSRIIEISSYFLALMILRFTNILNVDYISVLPQFPSVDKGVVLVPNAIIWKLELQLHNHNF